MSAIARGDLSSWKIPQIIKSPLSEFAADKSHLNLIVWKIIKKIFNSRNSRDDFQTVLIRPTDVFSETKGKHISRSEIESSASANVCFPRLFKHFVGEEWQFFCFFFTPQLCFGDISFRLNPNTWYQKAFHRCCVSLLSSLLFFSNTQIF